MRWYVDCDINELEGSVPYGIRVGKRLESLERRKEKEKGGLLIPFRKRSSNFDLGWFDDYKQIAPSLLLYYPPRAPTTHPHTFSVTNDHSQPQASLSLSTIPFHDLPRSHTTIPYTNSSVY